MKKFLTVLLVFCLVFLAACGSVSTGKQPTATPAEVKIISPADAKARLDSGEAVVLLDTDTAAAYETAHIDGAISLPKEDIGDKAPALLPVKDAEIIVCSGSGQGSADAAQKLVGLGYTNVSDLGSVQDWSYGTVSGAWAEKADSFSSFRASTLAGKPVDERLFSDYKLTMINVWATFCSPCLNEMPELGQLSKDYASKGVQIIGIVIDTMESDGSISQSQVELARQLVERTGASYTHLLPSADLLSAGLSGVSSVPTTFFVDATGNLVGESYVGSRSAEQWQGIIDGLLA